ncbi:MAG: FecR domain-containing protein [Elusimicrobia bacterium]|nr:FecR domain-containing protein [Elusimicrobiota bacterium]
MKLLIPILAVIVMTAPARAEEPPNPAQEPEEIEARLTRLEGSVYVHTSAQAEEEFIPAEEDMPLEAGDLIRTGSGSAAEVALDGDSIIEVGPDSDFIVNSLAKSESEFHLGIGSLAAKLKSLLGGQRMKFRTMTAVASVRGTELAMSQGGDDEPAHVGVFDEGIVSVEAEGAEGAVEIGPGQETEVRRGRPPGKARELRRLLRQKQSFGRIRGRLALLPKQWRPRRMEERRALRHKWGRRKPLRREQLKNIREDRRMRRYERLNGLREKLRGQRERRRERIEKPGPEQGERGERPRDRWKRIRQGGPDEPPRERADEKDQRRQEQPRKEKKRPGKGPGGGKRR